MTIDQYDFWRRRLTGEVVPIHDGEPQAGFYRLVSRDGVASQPVAYWFTPDGGLRCRVGKQDVSEQFANERWPYASKRPITHDVYKAVLAGEPWPDQNEAVAADRSNAAPDDNSFEGLKDRIEALARTADELIKAGPATDQAAADRASDLANHLGALQRQADAARAAEKKPHDDAVKAVQAKWLPVVTAADIYKRIKAAVITPFLVAEDQKRKAQEAEQRKKAEAAAQTGAPMPEQSQRAAGPKAGAAGRRSVALRAVKVVTIADRAAVLEFFKDTQQVTELLQHMAQKAVAAGVNVPGVTITEEQRAA